MIDLSFSEKFLVRRCGFSDTKFFLNLFSYLHFVTYNFCWTSRGRNSLWQGLKFVYLLPMKCMITRSNVLEKTNSLIAISLTQTPLWSVDGNKLRLFGPRHSITLTIYNKIRTFHLPDVMFYAIVLLILQLLFCFFKWPFVSSLLCELCNDGREYESRSHLTKHKSKMHGIRKQIKAEGMYVHSLILFWSKNIPLLS